MNEKLSVLRDPLTGGAVADVPVQRGIPRFVPSENYAADFGAQWNMFPKTQLDSHAGVPLSEARLARCLCGELPRVNGKRVLEAGSGAGRFTEVLLKYGAELCSFDYSTAVDANALNNGASDKLTLVQADIRKIPFEKASFDYVICLGVLQHTPSPEESIRSLWEMVKPGGRLVIDHYRFKWRNVLPPPIGIAEVVYRKVILALPAKSRFGAVKKIVDFWFPIHWTLRKSRFAQQVLRRISPVHFYYPQYRLRDRQMYYEWALLDTHDASTDFYKHHRSAEQISAELQAIGATSIDVRLAGNGVEAYCVKPEAITPLSPQQP